jgi:hypothetical protein
MPMNLQHLVVKIPIDGPLKIDPARVVDVFHKWVAAQSVPGVLLVDVAELLHVPKGPGVVAVGHEADFALDDTGGVWGALYRRKTVLPGSDADRLAEAFATARMTAARLEAAFANELRFSRTEFEIVVNDRGIAPNTPETRAAALPAIEAALRVVLGHGDFRLSVHDRDPRERFGVTVFSTRGFALPEPVAG